MTLADLKRSSSWAYPALSLERIISRYWRTRLRLLAGAAIVGGLIFSALAVLLPGTEIPALKIVGVLMIFSAVWLKLVLLELFFRDSYFRGVEGFLTSHAETRRPATADFETALTLTELSETDVTGSFLRSERGGMFLLRAGLSREETEQFLARRAGRFAPGQCVVKESDSLPEISFAELLGSILARDTEFSAFLFEHGVQETDAIEIAEWLTRNCQKAKLYERWWGRDALTKIPSIGREWAFGQAYALEKYSVPLPPAGNYAYNREETEKMEAALSREEEANVILVGDDEERKLEIVAGLERILREGEAFPQIAGKRLVTLDASAFSAANDEKGAFERELIKILNQVARAGNLILVIPAFTSLARSAETLGSDLLTLLDPYLASSGLQVIAMSSADEFHDIWERKALVSERFEKIILGSVAGEALGKILEDEAALLERKRRLIFTAPALKAIAEGGLRYLPEGIMPDAAIDLMLDLAARGGKGYVVIGKKEVEELIKEKTGIPVGAISAEEKDKLVNLENILRQRIVGQDEAVSGVANALRRARAGVGNPNRPIGSFLFLGPTGVGKTEMTKALSATYFNNEKEIERLDMSEYSSPDALDKLIGSFSTGNSGVFADMMREHPYGILLLDEFEKAGPKVHNLFLQVLDEGFFSDMSGKRVSLRNHMIIATSNAGSDLIWQAMSAGKNLLEEKANIIDEIIKQGIFKPELLNRFDGVILFHPLMQDNLKQVARLMLEKLGKRLKERGIILNINDDLVNYLAEKGTDPKFGARSMNRAIQDKVEQVIANKMIANSIKPGQELALSASDLA